MLPIIKVYDIDYSFIIKNYLNPEMWQKEWTLFVYKNFIVTLRIHSIDCYMNKITFKILATDKDNEEKYGYFDGIFHSNSTYNYVYFPLYVEDINILKKEIERTIKRCIDELENKLIKSSDGYLEIMETKKREKEILRGIAEDFLDNEHVTNDDIRDAYIDWYIDKMESTNSSADDFVDCNKYQMLTDIWYVFARIIKDDDLLEDIENSANEEELQRILDEYEEYKDYIYSDEYESDMADGLEDL